MRSPLALVRALFALALAALILTGCMKVDAVLVVNADDTLSGNIVMAVDRRLSAMTGESEEKLIRTLGLDRGKLPPTATVEPYSDDTYVGVRIRFDGTPLAEFTGTGGRDTFTIARADDEYAFTGTVDLRTVNLLDPGVRAFADQFSFRVSAGFPGKVVEHNGVLTGRTVTWQPKAGEMLHLRARAELPRPIAWLPLIAAGVGLAALATVAAVVLLARRRPRAETTLVGNPHDML